MSSSSPTAWQASRAFFSGGSSRRHEKFPARTIHNGPSVSRFDKLPADNRYASQIEAIARDTNNGESLEEYLDASSFRLGSGPILPPCVPTDGRVATNLTAPSLLTSPVKV